MPIDCGDVVVMGHVREYWRGLQRLDRAWPGGGTPLVDDCTWMIREHYSGSAVTDQLPFWRLFDCDGEAVDGSQDRVASSSVDAAHSAGDDVGTMAVGAYCCTSVIACGSLPY